MLLTQALHTATVRLAEGRPDGRIEARPTARRLVQHALGLSATALIAADDRELAAGESAALFALVERVLDGEPLAYILGHVPFGHLDLFVTPEVLIPRCETEELVAMVLAWARDTRPRNIVDVGTGTGCIALSLARALAPSPVDAVDVSDAALDVARRNARRNQIKNVRWHRGSLLEPLPGPFDLIVANLPYVAPGEWTDLADEVKYHEPKLALVADEDGLYLIRRLLEQATGKLRPSGAIFLEIGYRQAPKVCQMAASMYPDATVTRRLDYAGYERFIMVER
jgi:release factor glutamine methyltransferase